MTKEEFEQLSKEIKEKHGKPEWEEWQPMNESARQLMTLRTEYRMRLVASRRKERLDAGEKMRPEGLKEIAEGVLKDKAKAMLVERVGIPELFLNENDVRGFSMTEKEILHSYFNDLTLKPKQLAVKHQVSYQQVVALLDSTAFKILYTKVFDRILPFESLIALRQAMRKGDSKVSLEIARHYKLIQDETVNVNGLSKPIDDPKALTMLKDLGDKLADAVDSAVDVLHKGSIPKSS